MAKTFSVPQARTPRSAENDAAKLEAKKQFALLSADINSIIVDEPSKPEETPLIEIPLEVPSSIGLRQDKAVVKPEESELKIAGPILTIERTNAFINHAPLQESRSTVPTQMSTAPTPIVEEEAAKNILETKPLQIEQPGPLPSISYDDARYRRPVESSYTPQYVASKPALPRRQLTIYPSDRCMARLETIRVRDQIGSAMIIEHALEEYLATHSDDEIVALMRAMGHRKRRARL